MASIALSIVRCIDYIAYGNIFTRATFHPKIKLGVFFFARKAVDACREVVHGLWVSPSCFPPIDLDPPPVFFVPGPLYVAKKIYF